MMVKRAKPNTPTDTIVYTLVSKGGGMDGMDHTDKGGVVTHVFLTREEAENAPNKPWCNVIPVVVDLAKVAKQAAARLTPVERLALVIHPLKEKGR